jgi:two-component system, NtrC family, sensor kinase
MQSLTEPLYRSSVLLIAAPKQMPIAVGADFFVKLSDGILALQNQDYDVVALPLTLAAENAFQKSFLSLRERNPSAQLILLTTPTTSLSQSVELTNSLKISGLVPLDQSTQLEKQILQCLEKAQQEQQNAQLETLIKEQTDQLRSLYQDLDQRVHKRQKFLEESRRKTAVASVRWQALREALMATYQAHSIGEIETGLSQSLALPLQLSLTRIIFKPQDSYFSTQNKTYHSFSMFQAPLFRDHKAIGSIFFLRDRERAFHKDEGEFLLRVSEAVSLALDRLSHLNQSETLREQWQATFNAISDPVILINSNYEVLQANTSARARSPQNSFVHHKCYQLIFQRETPCTHCQFGKNFRLESRSEIIDVSSQNIQGLHFNLYHDISNQLKMERKILETVRLAELGTIGSSIAHELNNPLGGILSFVQLILMDLKPDDPIRPDIVEMELGVKRCRDIVQNLLGFTRNPDVDTVTDLDLKDVIHRAIKIVELQTKSQNIEIKPLLPAIPAPFRGHLNMLAQAIKNLLQLAIDSLIESQSRRGSSSVIEISLESSGEQWLIKILDNGPGEGRRNSLQFSISTQIIHEHEGLVELSAQPRQMTMAKISLPQRGF